jgi:uncharacterized protein (DUF58 family)
MFFGSRHQMKSVGAARTAALSAWRVIGVGDRIGALLFNDTTSKVYRPSRSPGALMGWLANLVSLNHQLTADSSEPSRADALLGALKKLSRYLTHDSLVIIISDFDGWDDQSLAAIKAIRQSNDVIAALITDPLERSLATADQLVVSDGAFQIQVESGKKEADIRFKAKFDAHVDSLGESLKRHKIPLISLTTESDIANQLLRQLGGTPAATAAAR